MRLSHCHRARSGVFAMVPLLDPVLFPVMCQYGTRVGVVSKLLYINSPLICFACTHMQPPFTYLSFVIGFSSPSLPMPRLHMHFDGHLEPQALSMCMPPISSVHGCRKLYFHRAQRDAPPIASPSVDAMNSPSQFSSACRHGWLSS